MHGDRVGTAGMNFVIVRPEDAYAFSVCPILAYKCVNIEHQYFSVMRQHLLSMARAVKRDDPCTLSDISKAWNESWQGIRCSEELHKATALFGLKSLLSFRYFLTKPQNVIVEVGQESLMDMCDATVKDQSIKVRALIPADLIFKRRSVVGNLVIKGPQSLHNWSRISPFTSRTCWAYALFGELARDVEITQGHYVRIANPKGIGTAFKEELTTYIKVMIETLTAPKIMGSISDRCHSCTECGKKFYIDTGGVPWKRIILRKTGTALP